MTSQTRARKTRKRNLWVIARIHIPCTGARLEGTEQQPIVGTLPKLIYDRRLAWLFFGLYGILVEIMPPHEAENRRNLLTDGPRFEETRNNAFTRPTSLPRAIFDRLNDLRNRAIVFSLCRVISSLCRTHSFLFGVFLESLEWMDAVQEKGKFKGSKRRGSIPLKFDRLIKRSINFFAFVNFLLFYLHLLLTRIVSNKSYPSSKQINRQTNIPRIIPL